MLLELLSDLIALIRSSHQPCMLALRRVVVTNLI